VAAPVRGVAVATVAMVTVGAGGEPETAGVVVVEETAKSNPAGTGGRGAEVGVMMGHTAAGASLSLARGSMEGVAVVTVAGIFEAMTVGIMVGYLDL